MLDCKFKKKKKDQELHFRSYSHWGKWGFLWPCNPSLFFFEYRIITQIENRCWANVGIMLASSLGRQWQMMLAQRHFAHWANVIPHGWQDICPTAINQHVRHIANNCPTSLSHIPLNCQCTTNIFLEGKVITEVSFLIFVFCFGWKQNNLPGNVFFIMYSKHLIRINTKCDIT